MQAPVRALLEDGALAGEWALDPRESSIRLKAKVIGLIPVNGVFREVSGNGAISPDGEVSGTVTVAAASIDTRNTRRDTHLRSADATASAQGDGEIWLDAEVRVNRADFGLTWNQLGMVSMDNALTIHAVFTRR